MVRPDQVSLGVLVNVVSRDAVDEAVAVCGVRERRSDGKLPAHVITYLTLALCLFPDDDYTEVATKVTGSLDRWGCWDASWSVPTSSAITQARKRLGRRVFAELFERTCGPVAGDASPVAGMHALGTARGSFLRGWRLLAIDGFEVDVPDTKENAAEFGYAGSGQNRSAFPKACVVALAECGTHAFVAAEVGAYHVGEKTLAQRLYLQGKAMLSVNQSRRAAARCRLSNHRFHSTEATWPQQQHRQEDQLVAVSQRKNVEVLYQATLVKASMGKLSLTRICK